MKVNNNKKGSNARKLIPAVGMLSVSAVMLATSTYAWFTMSREVEVQNIQMTATVPEDIQLSLGTIGSHSDTVSLAKNSGYLTSGDVSGVTAPTAVYDWSNTADISHYYTFGRLIPASSNTGANIYFTPDAAGDGRTLKTTAKFYTAATATAATAETVVGNTSSTNKLNATAHLNVASETGNWADGKGGARATAWNNTGDDGYYADIPIWFRTSSTAGASLSVKAYVVDSTASFGADTEATSDSKELYKAVRVAVLNSDGTVATTNNIIPVADGNGTLTNNNKYTGASIVDYYTADSTTQQGAGAISAVDSQGATTATYAAVTEMSANTSVIDLTGTYVGTGSGYGTARQYIIRVWLEGEDPDCYNATAGQDWSINLCFNNETTNAGNGGHSQDAAGGGSNTNTNTNTNTEHPDKTYTITVKTNAAAESGTTYTYTSTWNGTAYGDWTATTPLPEGTYYTAKDTTYTLPSNANMSAGTVTVYTENPAE